MKLSKIFFLTIPFSLLSCTAPIQNQQGSSGTYSDPSNPYAVPGVSTQGAYAPATQAPTTTPYQQIPSVAVNPPASIPTYTPTTTTSTPTTSGGSHTVSSGDTLWGLSRKYGVSVDDIRQANSLTSDTIVTGQTLSIPQ